MRYLIAIQICLSLITGNLSAQRTSSRIPPQDTIRNQRVTQTPVKPVETLPLVVARFYTMKKLVTNENFRLMGFESMEEVASAKLDPPIKDFMVRLDHLKRYVPGTNPDLMLTETGQQIFPVSAGEHVRSSMTLKRSLFLWKALSYGSPNFIKRLTEIITLSSASTGINRSEYFAVRIPALNDDFAGYL